MGCCSTTEVVCKSTVSVCVIHIYHTCQVQCYQPSRVSGVIQGFPGNLLRSFKCVMAS